MSRGKPAQTTDTFAGLPGATTHSVATGESLWSDVDSQLLHDAINAITAKGDACVIGISSDGGAMSFTILSNGEKRRFWHHKGHEMNDLLTLTVEWAASMAK